MKVNIYVFKGDLNWENRSGAFLFCRVYLSSSCRIKIFTKIHFSKPHDLKWKSLGHVCISMLGLISIPFHNEQNTK